MNGQNQAGLLEWLSLIVFGGQLAVFWKQLGVMQGQKELAGGQRELLQQQNDWRRDEAIGLFYQLAFGLREELRKADGLPNSPFNFHPGTYRTALDNAARTFAPLGNAAIMALAQARRVLTELEVVHSKWGQAAAARDDNGMLESTNGIRSLRSQMGMLVDLAQGQIPEQLRWRGSNGSVVDFGTACSDPTSLPPGA